jgi:hypothetical protein
MSIWGSGPTENDDAADWLGDLVESPSPDLLEEALSGVADEAYVGYLEIPECCNAVIAAEVLCQLLGEPGENPILEDEAKILLVDQLEQLNPLAVNQLVTQAITAVLRVTNDETTSELRDVWEEAESGAIAWMAKMKDLESRLRSLEARVGVAGPD